MRRTFILAVLCVSALPLFARQSQITMVTSFPVPFAGFPSVYVSTNMDVMGTDGGQVLELGNSGSKVLPLEVTGITTVNGRLNLNPGNSTSTDISTLRTGVVKIGDASLSVVDENDIENRGTMTVGESATIGTLTKASGATNTTTGLSAKRLIFTDATSAAQFELFPDKVKENAKIVVACLEGVHWERIGTTVYLVCGQEGEPTGETCEKGHPVVLPSADITNIMGGVPLNYDENQCCDSGTPTGYCCPGQYVVAQCSAAKFIDDHYVSDLVSSEDAKYLGNVNCHSEYDKVNNGEPSEADDYVERVYCSDTRVDGVQGCYWGGAEDRYDQVESRGSSSVEALMEKYKNGGDCCNDAFCLSPNGDSCDTGSVAPAEGAAPCWDSCELTSCWKLEGTGGDDGTWMWACNRHYTIKNPVCE